MKKKIREMDRDEIAWQQFKDVGGDPDVSINFGASMKGNSFSRRKPGGQAPATPPVFQHQRDAWGYRKRGFEEDMDFDTSDSPQEPIPPKRKGPPSAVPVRRNPELANRGHSYNPGMPPRKNEAGEVPPAGAPRRRPSQTMVMQPVKPQTPMSSPSGKWDVTLPTGAVVRVPAASSEEAQRTAGEWMKQQPRQQGASVAGKTVGGQIPATDPSAEVDFKRFKVVPSPSEASGAGGSIGAGPQLPLGEIGLEALRQLVNNRISEIVRKKEGGGGYNLYAPNKGKKKSAKPVGTFPSRLAAKRAELARFPPKDPEQLKRARKRLDKLAKDPKKRIDQEKQELSARKPRRIGKSARERKKAKKEAFIRSLSDALSERLFREEELPGSPWDERISGLHPDALGQDKKLHKYHQGMEKASFGALGDGHRALAKVMRGLAKINPGDISRDPERGKMFMPITMDVDGDEIGPIHLYIDGGHVCIEISPEARESIASLDPTLAKDLRGGLMSFQEDHLPKIDRARLAWSERDNYLDNLHKKLEKTVSSMSRVEVHLARQLMAKRRR